MQNQWSHNILNVKEPDFASLALEIFRYQYDYNTIYRNYVDALGWQPARVVSTGQIPFLPIRFFKSHTVQTGSFVPEAIFESSGTTGTATSRHHVRETGLYRASFLKTFESFYGPVGNYCVIGLLPSYLERSNSSLVYMVNELIKRSGHADSGFYLNEFEALSEMLSRLEGKRQPTLLIGVSFALLDFAESYPLRLKHTIVMETGGMKGRRREMVRPQVHTILKQAFGLEAIHSEYGMTELLSQAYSDGNGIFQTPPWMRTLIRDEEDPLTVSTAPGRGAINIIDLANIHSCCFIATDDAGILHEDGSFEVLGRIDNSDLRGCSLLLAN